MSKPTHAPWRSGLKRMQYRPSGQSLALTLRSRCLCVPVGNPATHHYSHPCHPCTMRPRFLCFRRSPTREVCSTALRSHAKHSAPTMLHAPCATHHAACPTLARMCTWKHDATGRGKLLRRRGPTVYGFSAYPKPPHASSQRIWVA